MSKFVTITQKPTGESKFKKTEYMRLDQGVHTVRILDSATEYFIHYVRRAYVECLDEECPVCENNQKIRFENPKNYSDVSGYSTRSGRYVFNVLDKTPVKVCPQCASENKVPLDTTSFSPTCTSCGTFITEVVPAPSNKVKILSVGVEVASMLDGYDKTITNTEGDIVGINNFDIVFNVRGVSRNKKSTPIPALQNMGAIEFNKEDLFDHGSSLAQLNLEEVHNLLKGVTLRDIYLARRSTPVVEESATLLTEIDEASEIAIGRANDEAERLFADPSTLA